MSGGSYNYEYHRVLNLAEEIEQKAGTHTLRRALADHMKKVSEACRAIEWVDSGDWLPGHEDEYILCALNPASSLEAAVELAQTAMKELEKALARVASG